MASPPPTSRETNVGQQPGTVARVLEAVAEAVGRLRYGQVQLTIHDGKVVQMDVTERQRFS